MKYRKKPVVIEAWKWDGITLEDAKDFVCHYEFPFSPLIGHRKDGVSGLVIPTLEGDHIATTGDYIIKDVNGEFYPCKPDIFQKTYEPLESEV